MLKMAQMFLSLDLAIYPISLLVLSLTASSHQYQYEVPCTPFTPSCSCPPLYKGEKVEVCHFSLNLQTLQSFTSYYLPLRLGGRAGYGSAWYINSTTGDFLPLPNAKGRCGRLEQQNMSTGDCSLPFPMDGYTYRSYIAVNGQFPGPTLIAYHDQTLVVDVSNWLSEQSVAIHWHGLHQRGTNWMDGVQGLTQCGIEPGKSFRYIFSANPHGTFWYHAHSGSLRVDGLFGALVIKESKGTLNKVMTQIGLDFIDAPDNHTMTLFDLQEYSTSQVNNLVQANAPSFNGRTPPYQSMVERTDYGATETSPIPFWSGLINGRGRHPSIGYTGTRLSIFKISPSQVYRFRVIGAQGAYSFLLSIDEHLMTVLTTDGSFIDPVTVDHIVVSSGERFDVLVKGKGLEELEEKTSFMIRGRTLEPVPNANINDELLYRTDHTAEAILHYDISPEPDSTQYSDIAKPVDNRCTLEGPCIVLNCPFPSFPPSYNISCLHIHSLRLLNPLPHEDLPQLFTDQKIFLNFAFGGYDGTSSVNARNFQMPSRPLSLLNSSEFKDVGKDMFCKDLSDPLLCDTNLQLDAIFSSSCLCSHVKTVLFNQSLQLVFSALGPDPSNLSPFFKSHPIHLHGHQFQVADVQFGTYDETGRLSQGNTDIDCGGTHLCTVPRWKNGKDYSEGRKGRLDATAPLKDTVQVPAGGYVVAYIRTTNPGHWFLHCHNDHHLSTGMASILSEAVDFLASPPESMKRQCSVSMDDGYSVPGNNTSTNGGTEQVCHGKDVVLVAVTVSLGFLLLMTGLLLIAITTCLCYHLKCFGKAELKNSYKNVPINLLMTKLDNSLESET